MWNQFNNPQPGVVAQVKQSLFVRTMNYTALWTVLYGLFVAFMVGTGLDRFFGNPVVSLILALMVVVVVFYSAIRWKLPRECSTPTEVLHPLHWRL
jgi:uncharacterized membrane protein